PPSEISSCRWTMICGGLPSRSTVSMKGCGPFLASRIRTYAIRLLLGDQVTYAKTSPSVEGTTRRLGPPDSGFQKIPSRSTHAYAFPSGETLGMKCSGVDKEGASSIFSAVPWRLTFQIESRTVPLPNALTISHSLS